MKSFVRTLVLGATLFLSCGALYGGWQLMMMPDGSRLGFSTRWLAMGPFSDYFIPGSVLFSLFGLGGLLTLLMTWVRQPRYALYLLAWSELLLDWILVQLYLFDKLSGWQAATGVLAILLFLAGIHLYVPGRPKTILQKN